MKTYACGFVEYTTPDSLWIILGSLFLTINDTFSGLLMRV